MLKNVIAFVFLFQGEPNLWSVLHKRAISAAECAK
jgi:hypothetical protein